MAITKTKDSIKEYIEERGIESLYHFTKAENLDSILTRGLLSRRTLEDNYIDYTYNDEIRFEGKLNANCLSISFPNYRMFYKYRCENPGVEWCVIELSPEVLYKKKCIFCKENPASAKETTRLDCNKVGIDGLKQLFENEELRRRLNLEDKFTTNPQAEVLVMDDIELDYIKGIYFRSKNITFDYSRYPQFTFYWCKYLFDARKDHNEWS